MTKMDQLYISISVNNNDIVEELPFPDITRRGNQYTLHKKRSFPLRISSVYVTKFTGNCRFGHIY